MRTERHRSTRNSIPCARPACSGSRTAIRLAPRDACRACLAELLRAADHDCAHIYELGLGGRPDEQIMVLADRDNRVLISAGTDFGELLANAPVLAPSVVLLRRTDRRAASLAAVIIANPGRSPRTLPRAR